MKSITFSFFSALCKRCMYLAPRRQEFIHHCLKKCVNCKGVDSLVHPKNYPRVKTKLQTQDQHTGGSVHSSHSRIRDLHVVPFDQTKLLSETHVEIRIPPVPKPGDPETSSKFNFNRRGKSEVLESNKRTAVSTQLNQG